MSDLLQLRGEIDRIDREIVRLFEQRMEVTDEVGRYKIENGKRYLTESGNGKRSKP